MIIVSRERLIGSRQLVSASQVQKEAEFLSFGARFYVGYSPEREPVNTGFFRNG